MSDKLLKDQHIFLLGTTKFDGNVQSTSFNVARELARQNFVWYVDYPFTWKDCLKPANWRYLLARLKQFLPGSDGVIRTANPRLNILIVPPLLSLNFLSEGRLYRRLLAINELLIRRRIRRILRKQNVSEFIYINSFNFHYPGVAKTLQPALTVYHCVDPMIIPYDMKHGIQSENELVKACDVVLCTSKQLLKEKSIQNSNCYFVGNAVHTETVTRSNDPDTAVHPLLRNIKEPVIGYAGSIERRLDYQLILDVARLHPDKKFVFAGPVPLNLSPPLFLILKT